LWPIILKEKLKERGADYKVLCAFSDFVHPVDNQAILAGVYISQYG